MASNFCYAESVSKLTTNTYNFDEAIALKVEFVLYILPQIRVIVLVSAIFVLHCPRHQHFCNRAILETIMLL